MKFNFTLKFTVLLVLFFGFTQFTKAQTTYTWIGGNGSWAVNTNWSPATVPPSSNTNTIVEFSDGGTYTVTAVPALAVRQLRVINNTSATLQSSGTTTISMSSTVTNENFLIEAGSSLSNTATNIVSFVMTANTQTATIAGTYNINGGTAHTLYNATVSGTLNMNLGTLIMNNATSPTSFTSTSVLNHTAGAITGSATGLFFTAGSIYNYLGTGALTIPTATWDVNSIINVTGITTAVTIAGTAQSFGTLNYNCTSQGNVAVTFAATSTTRFKGDFNLVSTGAGSGTLSFKNGATAVTLNIDGLFNQSGGSMIANIAATASLTLNLNGGFSQSAGTFNLSTAAIACVLNLGGNFNQTAGTFTQTSTTVSTFNFTLAGNRTYAAAGTITNTNLNYVIVSPAQLTLNSNLTTSASRTFIINAGATLVLGSGNLASAAATGGLITNSGTLILSPTSVISGSGGFTNTSAAATTLSLGSQFGIASSGASGNIQVTGTRTYGLAANYIYTGTTGQITGNALPVTCTGFILVDLQNNSDQITFTNSAFSGSGVNLRLRSGALANAITYTNATSSILTYEGVAAQTSTDNEFPAISGPRRLTINNPNGVTLHAARDLPTNGIFTLTDGILTTSTTNILSVLNTAAATAVVGGTATSFVNGPIIRAFNSAGTYSFPVGDASVFAPVDLVTTAAASGVQLRVQHINAASGGTAGSGLSAINPYHWLVERTAGSTALPFNVILTQVGLVANSRVGYATTVVGAYANQGGINIASSITSVNTNTIDGTNPNAYYTVGTSSTLSGTVSALNLTTIADLLRTQIVTGNVIFELPTTYTGEPAYPVNFTEFAEDGGGPYTVTIRPEAGSANFLTAGDPGSTNTLIDFNGIDRLSIDGRANGVGPIQWIFRNTRAAATYGPTFRFINGATNNTLTYLNVESQAALASTGTIAFSTSTALLGGNSDNTISNCNIRENTANSVTYTNGIYSLGTAGALNSGNQILNNAISNCFNATLSSSAIFVSSNNSSWTITGNHIYQTATRNSTGGIVRYGIQVNSTVASSDNYTISNNFIGGNQPNANGTAYTITGNVNHMFYGIYIQPAAAATNCVVDGNTIKNLSLSHGGGSNGYAFIGIYSLQGNQTITNNTIGSITGSELITFNSTYSAGVFAYGIYITAGIDDIQNNTIAGFNSPSTSGFMNFQAIFLGSSSSGTNCSNNVIRDLNIAYTGTLAQLRGIVTSASGTNTIENNQIYNLTTSSGATGIGAVSSLIGISQVSITAGENVSGNLIHSLHNTAASAQVNVIGIYCANPITGVNNISKNNIHSLSLSSSNAASSIIGINAFSGIATYHNNMIRLGIDAAGSAITTGYNIAGIQQSSATANNLFYFNTIYIGGTGVSGNNNTYAYQRLAGALATNIRNNILFNERENSSGTAINYGIGLNASTATTSNFNIYKADGSNGNVGLINTTSYPALTDWQNTFSNDINSLYGPIPFINATGNAAAVNLHINPLVPTQNESVGTYIANYGDIDGDIRFGEPSYAGTGTAPDVGADEGDFLPADLTPPTIIYTLIPTQTVLTGPALVATITDASGVNITAGTKPRLYFKYTGNNNTYINNTNASNGWKYVESVSVASPFSFTIDYSLLFGGVPAGGETLDYFVVAQDLASPANVAINSGTFNANPTSVALTAAAFPLTGSVNNYVINVLSGTVTVGTGGNYLSLTNNGGLFEAINTGALSSNVNAQIISDLTVESGTHALNQWTEIGAGNYTLTIQSNNNTTKTISGAFSGALYRFNGADRVIIDGRDPANIIAGGKHLIFVNTTASAAAATLQLINEATNNIIKYSILRGSTTSSTLGVVVFSTSTAGTIGNSSNIIDNCDIHQNAAALPINGIYSAGTALKVNVNNTISNNNIYNFFSAAGGSSGILLAANTSQWTIENNKFYQESTRTTTSASIHYVINVNNTSNANTIIRGNYIGCTAADGSGIMNYTSTFANQFAPIYLNTSSTVSNAAIVENNTITNISFTTISGGTSGIGPFTAIYQLAGASIIKGNTIGASTGNNTIVVTVNTNANGVVNAIRYDGTSTAKIENNTIGGITVTGTGTNNGTNFYAVNITTGNVAIKNNLIGSASTSNSIQINGTATANASVLGAINIVSSSGYLDSVVTNNIYNLTNFNGGTATRIFGISATSGAQYFIEDNTIRNLSLTNSTNIGSTSTPAVLGIALATANNQPLSISRNTIHSLSNGGSGASAFTTGIHYNGGSNSGNVVERNFVHSLSPSSGAAASVIGIQISGGTTTNVRNNKVRLGIASNGAAITQPHTLYGIEVISTSTTNIFHNSVYLGGAVTGVTALNSNAFRRTATTGTINIQNNIFVNARSQSSGGKHFCIYTPNITTFTSDYNILYPIGTQTFVGLFNTTDATTLANWRAATTNRDLNSSSCDPAFENPTGTATTVDLHLNAITGTAAEGRGNPVALSPAVLLDFDGDTRDIPALNTVDIGADAGNYTPLTGPTLNAQANASNPLATCQGNAVTFSTTATGGSTCGTWQYSWFNGSQYWNGTDFASASEIFNTTWNSINVSSLLVSGTYTVRANCVGDLENCIATTQSTVVVTLNSSPTTLTPVIGNPANGLNHFIDLTWDSAAGITAYEVEFSTNNSTWNSLYLGTNLAFSHNTGDSPNAPYYYRVRSIFGLTTCNWTNATTFPIHTAADAPNVIVLNNATSNSMDLALQAETPLANPSATTYSIFSPTVSLYLQASGALGASEVFQTLAAWGTTTVIGLTPSTEYCFFARARNNDGDIREGSGSNALGLETFTTNANFATGASDLTRFYSPSSCTTGGLLYSATGGCADGRIGRSGTYTNFFGCYVRTPQVNCTGNASMKVFFDVSHSYFASQPNDKIRMYMWADGMYKNLACTSIKIDGIEVGFIDGTVRSFSFSQLRNCKTVEATFDLSTTTDKSAVLFYIEPNNGYNNTNVFSVVLDNISVFGGPPPTCLFTAPLLFNGDYTIGTGGDYPSLTNAGGLFEAINSATLSGNVTATVISDLTVESGTHALNQWNEVGAGNYTLTIRPDGNTQRVITGTYSGANASVAGLYRFNGADRVIIDGRNPSNLGAGDRNLLFRNINTTVSNFNGTITLINDAKDFEIKYSVIEGATTGTANGALRISTSAAAGSGNDNIIIDNCFIRDLSSGVGAPSHGIYALGTFSRTNDNITISNNQIFNYHLATTSPHAAIYIGNYNDNCTINANSIYQEVTHTTASNKFGIIVDNTSAGNFTVSNNYIGGNAAGATGTWQVNASGQDYRFTAISMSTAITPTSVVENNTIRNFDITTGTTWQTQGSTFTGIYGSNGVYAIQNNTIGSLTQNANINIVCSAGQFTNVQGIFHAGNGAVNVLNNQIGGIEVSNTASSANIVNLYGVRASSASSITVNNNTLGSLAAPLINASGNSYVSASSIITAGIHIVGIGSTTVNNNNVNHVYYTTNGTSTTAFQVAGIYRTSAAATSNTFQGNTVTNIRSNSAFAGVADNIGLAGIYFVSQSNNNSVIGNTIHSIKNTNATAGIGIQVAGLYYSTGSNASVNTVNKNFIHSLTTATTSTTATITGLWLNAGSSTINNNMIRLGIIGATSQTNGIINGINEADGLNLTYFNSVYIGGTGANNTANTHTFISAVASGARQLQNNIFYNARSNAGAGKNYAIRIGGTTGLTSNYNLLHVSGTNGVLGYNGSDQINLNVWKSATGLDLNSIGSNPLFINSDGDENNVDLHIQVPPVLTPIEAAGNPITGLDFDFDNDVRSTYTPTDIGADAGNFLNLDVSPPLITYTPIPNQANCGAPSNITLLATVTDAQSGISLVSNFPRLYIRRSIGGAPGDTWGSLAQITGSFVSGTSNVSQWQFTIDYTALGITALPGNEFEYYIVAQDISGAINIGYTQNNGTRPLNSNVSTPILYPNFTLPANGTFNFSNPLTGTVTVGVAGDYPNFNNNTTGLFKAIMDRGIASDLEVLVISNVDESADYYPLGVVQEFCGSNYTITIKPNAASPYLIQSNTFGANPLINFIGTKRVIIDGSFAGSGKYLTFRQRSTQSCVGTSNPTFYFSGTASSAASEIEIKNTVIEGNNRLTACIGAGVLNFGNLLSTGMGMNNISINNNTIRNRSDIAQNATNTPWTLIQIGAQNSTNIPRSNIQITNNSMFNFGESAVQIRQNNAGQGIGNGFVISGNKIYQAYNIPTYHYPIWLEGGTNSHSHVIANNLIGGSAEPSPNITGTWSNTYSDGEMQAIYVLVGGSTAAQATSIQGNKIKNINLSGTGWTNFVGIRVEEGRVRIGDVVGNVIGSEDDSPDNIISNGSGGAYLSQDAAVMGIWTQSASETIIENNIVSGLSTGLGLYCFLDGIAHGSNLYFNDLLYNYQGGTAIIRNNQIKNNRSSSNLQNSSVSNEGMISLFVYTNSMTNVIEGNLIQNNGCNALAAANVRNTGVLLGVFGQVGNHGGVFRKNTIAALANANSGQAGNVAPEVNGLAINYGNWEVSNNMISLRNGTTGTNITNKNTSLVGIRDGLLNSAGQGAQYLYNSVYIYGQNGGSGTANASYAFLRFAIDYTGPVLSNGAPTTLRNNIFVNERIGIGKHRAIGNIATNPAIGWNASASNYNFVCNLNTSVATRWGTTDYTWANWLTLSSGDANSTFKPAAATTIANVQLKPTDLFESDYLFGNLRISLLNTDATNFVDNLGTPISVIVDIDGDGRHATTPDRGADEFNFCQFPDVTLQPANQSNACIGSTVNFATTVTGLAPLTLQWQESTNGGVTWNNLSNTGIYSGTSTNTLTLTSITAGLDNNKYRLFLTNACGIDSSDAAVLTLSPAPLITAYSPLSFVNSICSGNTNFKVTATGNTLTYQWQLSTDNGFTWSDVTNVLPYVGATTNQLSINNIPPPNLDGNKYRVIITDACSTSITSNVGTLNIGVANITVQPPVTQTVCAASNTTIAVTATGSGTNYQWQVSTNNGGAWSNVSGAAYSNANSNTLGIAVDYTMNNYQYRVIVNSTCNVPSNSDVSVLKVELAGQWLGAGSDWDTPSNWGCGVVPTNTTNVLIPSVPELGNVFPIVNGNSISQAKNITIETGASLTVQNNKDLSIHGKLINNGTAALGDGTIKFVANLAQQIEGTTLSEFGKLSLNNTYTLAPALELNQHVVVKNELILNNGKLNLNGYEITVGQMGIDGVISASSASSYIIADGLGSMLKRYTLQTAKNYNFPVGDNSAYSPLNLLYNTAGLGNSSMMQVKVTPSAHPNIGGPLPTSYLKRYWTAEPLNINGALNYNISYVYDDVDIAGVEANIKAYKHNAGGWIAAIGSGASYEVGTANYTPASNQIVWNGLTSFSDFTGIGYGSPLPISLLSFNAYPVLNTVEIVWTTASEINNDYFTVERSKDALHFEDVMQTAGAGNSNQILNYKETDFKPYAGTSYYRLKQTDFDGQYTYSDIRTVSFSTPASSNSITVFPNPVEGNGIYIKNGLLESHTIDIKLMDMLGQIIQENKLEINPAGDEHFIRFVETLSVGVYHLQITNNQKVEVIKLVVKK